MAATTTVNKKAPKVAGKKKLTLKKGVKKTSGPIVKGNTLTLKKLLMRVQFVTDNSGKRISALMPIKTFEKILEELEELEDIRLYDKAKRAGGKSVPIEEAYKRLEARRKKV